MMCWPICLMAIADREEKVFQQTQENIPYMNGKLAIDIQDLTKYYRGRCTSLQLTR